MGNCLDGEYAGSQLEMIPVVQTSWSQWVKNHPETRVLKKSEEIKSSQYESYFKDPERAGLFPAVWLKDRLPGKSLVHGVLVGPYSLAVADLALVEGKPVEKELGGVTLRMTRDQDGGVRCVRLDTSEEIQVRTAFWFAWSTYFPRTEVVE